MTADALVLLIKSRAAPAEAAKNVCRTPCVAIPIMRKIGRACYDASQKTDRLRAVGPPASASAWVLAAFATAAATREVVGDSIVLAVLTLIQWRAMRKRFFVLVEPLAYPLVCRHPVGAVVRPTAAEGWAFAAVLAALVTTPRLVAATAWWTGTMEAHLVLLIMQAQVLPLAYVVHPAAIARLCEMRT